MLKVSKILTAIGPEAGPSEICDCGRPATSFNERLEHYYCDDCFEHALAQGQLRSDFIFA